MRILLFLGAFLALLVSLPADDAALGSGLTRVDLVFHGGHVTDPRDRGRPVTLIAAALGVPGPVFREAFSHVHPAGPGQQPQDAQVRQNKQALMQRLAPYGVTDDRLNLVSNYYRYRRETGLLWRHVDAAGYALVKDGRIVKITLTNPGAGYTTPPTVSVPGAQANLYPIPTLTFGTDLAINGSIAKIDLSPTPSVAPGGDDGDSDRQRPVPDDGKPAPPPPPPPPQ